MYPKDKKGNIREDMQLLAMHTEISMAECDSVFIFWCLCKFTNGNATHQTSWGAFRAFLTPRGAEGGHRASSRSTAGLRTNARAIATRCRWPPDSCSPRAPMGAGPFGTKQTMHRRTDEDSNKKLFAKSPKTPKKYHQALRHQPLENTALKFV